MPRYVYKCQSCDGVFEVVHGMTEEQTYCKICSKTNCVKRIPQMPSVKIVDQQAGQIVREYIEDTKKELREEKKKLKKQEYKPS